MKTSIVIFAIAACALSAPFAWAQEKSAPAKPAMNMDMDKSMSQMHEKMKAMQAQMDAIQKTTDPKERQKLMAAHMQAMQENMKAMRGMGGPRMMGGSGERGGMMMDGKKDGMKDGDMMRRHEMMGNRMDMMQMMMEQMMQHDHAMESMLAK